MFNQKIVLKSIEFTFLDGVLWDVRSGKEIHKFEKFNQCISGVFHPNCLEVRSETERGIPC